MHHRIDNCVCVCIRIFIIGKLLSFGHFTKVIKEWYTDNNTYQPACNMKLNDDLTEFSDNY